MKILEDFKEILYDILGFVLPGMFAMIIFIPMIFFSNNETWTSFVTEISKDLIEKRGPGIEIETTNELINIISNDHIFKFLSQNKILITVFFIAMAYLMGCAVHFGAKKYYQMMYLVMDMKGFVEIDEYDKSQARLLANERKNNKFLESTLESKRSSKRIESIIRYTLRRNDNSSLVGKYIGKYNFFMSFSFLFLITSMFFIEKDFGRVAVGLFLVLHITSRVVLKCIDIKIRICKSQLKNIKNIRVKVAKLTGPLKQINERNKSQLENIKNIKLKGVELKRRLKPIKKIYEDKLNLLKLFKVLKVLVLIGVVFVFRQYYMFISLYIIHLGLNSEYIRHYNLSKKEAFLGMADYLSK